MSTPELDLLLDENVIYLHLRTIKKIYVERKKIIQFENVFIICSQPNYMNQDMVSNLLLQFFSF